MSNSGFPQFRHCWMPTPRSASLACLVKPWNDFRGHLWYCRRGKFRVSFSVEHLVKYFLKSGSAAPARPPCIPSRVKFFSARSLKLPGPAPGCRDPACKLTKLSRVDHRADCFQVWRPRRSSRVKAQQPENYIDRKCSAERKVEMWRFLIVLECCTQER
jgi:hypothetical protein